MFEARINQGVLLKKVFEAVKELANEVNIEVSEKGLELQAMDTSQVSLVRLEMKTEAFDSYRCDRVRALGLNMATVVKVMKMCNNDDCVTLKHEEDTDYITFIFENESESKTSAFKMKLMIIDDERMVVPVSSFDASVVLASKIYGREISNLSTFSDIIKIQVTKEGTLTLIANGDAGQASSSFHPQDGNTDVVVNANSEVQLSFGTRHLNIFSKAMPIAQSCELRLTDGQPLLMLMNLNDDPNIGNLLFFLAPKQDDEGDEMAE